MVWIMGRPMVFSLRFVKFIVARFSFFFFFCIIIDDEEDRMIGNFLTFLFRFECLKMFKIFFS